MKKIKLALVGAALVLGVGGAFAFNHTTTTAKVDSSDWFALDPNSGALITPAQVVDPADCPTGTAHYCAARYTTNAQGQPTGQPLETKKKP